MIVSEFVHAAGIALLLGPLTHICLWSRIDLDSNSHELLLVANLIVLLGPVFLYIKGCGLIKAVLLSWTVNICYASALLLSIAFYRAYIHPLRHYNGPFWARVTVFWKVKHFKTSDFRAFAVVDKLHQEYGDVVRIGPRQLSINDPSAYNLIYGANSQCHRLVHLEALRKNLQSLSNHHEHQARRKVWDHGLSAKACQTYLPRLNEITNRLCTAFERKNGQPFVVNDYCHFYTFDVMGDIGFGRSYGQIESGVVHPAVNKVHNFLKAGVIAIQMLWVVNFLRLIPGLDDPMRDLKEWAEQLLAERSQLRAFEKHNEIERDLMSYVEESKKVVDTRWPMSDKDIAEDAVTLQIAGSDTSYSVIANVFHYLANYPALQERIRTEILQTFDQGDLTSIPAWNKLGSSLNCPYLDATVKEVMRKHPPVPQGTLRESPNHTIDISGHIIPPKTILSCPIWTLQHDDRCFKESHQFIPERWLDSDHAESRADLVVDKRGFVPFSVGPMNCAGKYFAYMEIKVLIAKILQRFEISFPETEALDHQQKHTAQTRDSELASEMRDYLTQVVGKPVEVCFKPRSP